MKRLIIAEKPSVAKEIARVLGYKEARDGAIYGKDGAVTWALGHLVTLEAPEGYDKAWANWSLETLPMLPSPMKLTVIPETRKQYKKVESLLRQKDFGEIIIATDAGREGELVARWIIEKSGVKKPMKRLWISSQTDKAIKEGFNHLKPAKAYDALYQSAVARAEADWLVGLNVTRALTCHFNVQLSAGRVQTPTLAVLAQREKEIRAFRPKPYYELGFEHQGYKFHWQGKNASRLFDEKEAKALYERLKNEVPVLLEKKIKEKKEFPEPLYDLTTLQREANQAYGFSAKETLRYLQSLYEQHKVLTYPRTDSRYLTKDMVATFPDRLKAINTGSLNSFAKEILAKKSQIAPSVINEAKVSDHHAIIPTEIRVSTCDLSANEYKIYTMVAKRFLSQFMGAYLYQELSLSLKLKDEVFNAKGKTPLSLGYKVLWEESLSKAKDFDEKKLTKIHLNLIKGETKPPSRFTEASLLGFMENPSAYVKDKKDKEILKSAGGIGTPATRADIIEKLYQSFYIEKRDNILVPTQKGLQLAELVPEPLISPELTASWEEKLEKIAQGKLSPLSFDKEIRTFTKSLVKDVKASEKSYRHDNLTRKPCPECGKFLLLVNGKKGKMHVCQDRNCGYRESLTILTNARCPECKKKLEIIKSGEKKRYICNHCGYRESYEKFNEARQKAKGTSKKDAQKYIKQMQKEEKISNNPFLEALKGLKSD